jgi:hypothetical protein
MGTGTIFKRKTRSVIYVNSQDLGDVVLYQI